MIGLAFEVHDSIAKFAYLACSKVLEPDGDGVDAKTKQEFKDAMRDANVTTDENMMKVANLRERENLDEQHDEQMTLDLMFRSIRLNARSIRGSMDIFHYAFCHAGILTGNTT